MAPVDDLPEGLGSPFDKLLAVKTIGVWHEPAARFADLAGRMRPGGGVALVSQPRCPGATAETTIAAGCDLAAYLGEAGFSDLRSETLKLRPAVVCVLGSRQWNPRWTVLTTCVAMFMRFQSEIARAGRAGDGAGRLGSPSNECADEQPLLGTFTRRPYTGGVWGSE